MATCASCGKIEEGELEAFCQHCGERREAVATPSPAGNAANKSEDEIVEEYVVDERKVQRLAPLSTEKELSMRSPLLGPRRASSRGNVKRISIRLIPCEFEDGGVELVRALASLSEQQEGWVLTRYRDDNATLFLQGAESGVGSIANCKSLLKDAEQQYLLVRLAEEKDNIRGLVRNVLITWRGRDIPHLLKGKFHEHKDIVAKMFDDVHAWLVCNGERANINEALIRERSAPLSGSHEL